MKLKAIETVYGGHRFRSRLEARWAILFDALGLNWEYEMEGFEFEDGTKYLPDFFIYDTNWFIEVKPDVPLSKSEINKINKLDDYPPDYAWGVGVTPKLELIKSPKVSFPNESIASSYKPNEFSVKELINGADVNNWSVSRPQSFYRWFLGQNLSGDNINFINQAILKAMQARFEFGEEVDQKWIY